MTIRRRHLLGDVTKKIKSVNNQLIILVTNVILFNGQSPSSRSAYASKVSERHLLSRHKPDISLKQDVGCTYTRYLLLIPTIWQIIHLSYFRTIEHGIMNAPVSSRCKDHVIKIRCRLLLKIGTNTINSLKNSIAPTHERKARKGCLFCKHRSEFRATTHVRFGAELEGIHKRPMLITAVKSNYLHSTYKPPPFYFLVPTKNVPVILGAHCSTFNRDGPPFVLARP